jgi:hypothetical protein
LAPRKWSANSVPLRTGADAAIDLKAIKHGTRVDFTPSPAAAFMQGVTAAGALSLIPFPLRRALDEGATGNSMVIAGQPISGIGLWLRLTLCCAASTEFTVPEPWASLWPACAICMSLCCGDAACASVWTA